MRRPFVAGNWKMNGALAFNSQLVAGLQPLEAYRAVETAVCPPAIYLGSTASLLAGSSIKLGAQDASEQSNGAFTGEVSAEMLREVGCSFAIVGHSERRARHGESNELVAAKAKAVLASGLVPIVCVGETLSERESGRATAVVAAQVAAVTSALDQSELCNIIIAYEPVWAIGTGLTATPVQAQEVHAMIRASLKSVSVAASDSVRIIYGGSVKPSSASELFAQTDIDGGLIGGAALVAADFCQIVAAALQRVA